MQQIHRFMIGIPLAFGVTFGLGELMIGLIRVEHISLAERAQKLGFDINPKIEEVKIIHERLKPRPLKPVEPPPAPPVIEHESPALPDETFKNTPTPIPETGPIDLDMGEDQGCCRRYGRDTNPEISTCHAGVCHPQRTLCGQV